MIGTQNPQQGAQEGQQGASATEAGTTPQADFIYPPTATVEASTAPAKPVTIPVPQAKAQAPVPAPKVEANEVFEYDPTGNRTIDYALAFAGKNGYGLSHPGIQAAQQGDFSILRADMAVRGLQGAKEVIDLAEAAQKEIAATSNAAQVALQDYAYQAVGGKDNWEAVVGWCVENLPANQIASLNQSLAAGGPAAEASVESMIYKYTKENSLEMNPRQVSRNTAGAQGQGHGAPMLTAEGYTNAIKALQEKNPGKKYYNHEEYAYLRDARLRGMKAGYGTYPEDGMMSRVREQGDRDYRERHFG